jgi:taurine dioxygenase
MLTSSSHAPSARYNPGEPKEGGMTAIEPTGQVLGATVSGIDLSKPVSDRDFATILLALGRHGVLRFPAQRLEAAALRDFSRRFGRIQATLTGRHHEPGIPKGTTSARSTMRSPTTGRTSAGS